MIPVLVALACLTAEDPDAASLIRQHEASLARIRTIRARITIRVSQDGGETWRTMNQIRVIRDGRREKVTSRGGAAYVPGTREIVDGFSESQALNGPERRLRLLSRDPGGIPAGPVDYAYQKEAGRTIEGGIDPPRPVGTLGPRDDWAMAALISAGWGESSLNDLWKAAGRPAAARADDRDGHPVYQVTGKLPDGNSTRVTTISPEHHFALAGLKTLDRRGKVLDYFGDLHVASYHEPGPGLFLPRSIRGASPDGAMRFEIDVDDLAVNGPIDEAEFTLRFPEGIAVVDATKGNRISIWGDGRPRLTFKTLKEFQDWMVPRRFLARVRLWIASMSDRLGLWRYVGAAGVLFALIVLNRRTWRSRHHRAASRVLVLEGDAP